MAAVEALLREELRSEVPLLNEVCEYVIESGGKRLRPALVLLSGAMFGAEEEHLLPAAAAVEMIHTATLLHDDILDASPMRRGRLTVSRRWNAKVAATTGDYILARAFGLLSRYNRVDVLQAFSEVTTRLCRGEELQARHRRDLGITIEDYLEIINCKTAFFISRCCLAGGLLGGATPDSCDALAEYGDRTGIVFQITDDLLDYLGDTVETGKDVGADFREGKFTLPVIMALRGDDDTALRLRDVLASGDPSDATFQEVRRLVIESGAAARARDFAERCTAAAVEALAPLPAGVEREALEQIARWIQQRKR
jgi:octaprenyl-diphosphate synthase